MVDPPGKEKFLVELEVKVYDVVHVEVVGKPYEVHSEKLGDGYCVVPLVDGRLNGNFVELYEVVNLDGGPQGQYHVESSFEDATLLVLDESMVLSDDIVDLEVP